MSYLPDQYADAMVRLEDRVSSAAAKAEDDGLTQDEVAKELRRIADEIEAESEG